MWTGTLSTRHAGKKKRGSGWRMGHCGKIINKISQIFLSRFALKRPPPKFSQQPPLWDSTNISPTRFSLQFRMHRGHSITVLPICNISTDWTGNVLNHSCTPRFFRSGRQGPRLWTNPLQGFCSLISSSCPSCRIVEPSPLAWDFGCPNNQPSKPLRGKSSKSENRRFPSKNSIY